jgi:hypothetical protein
MWGRGEEGKSVGDGLEIDSIHFSTVNPKGNAFSVNLFLFWWLPKFSGKGMQVSPSHLICSGVLESGILSYRQ